MAENKKFNIYEALGIEDVPITVSIEPESIKALYIIAGTLAAGAIVAAFFSNFDKITNLKK